MNPPLVFLHGWGQSSRIWYAQAKYFTADWNFYIPNLPGHGGSATANPEDWLDALARQLPDRPCILVGWSLGGMLAMQLALAQPDRILGLALVSTTPCFCSRLDWQHGCPSETFQAFEQGVGSGNGKALGRFFALMLHGDGLSRPAYNRIANKGVDRQQPPSQDILQEGLELLATTDLRPELQHIRPATLVMHGENDAIIPITAGQYLAKHIPQSHWLKFVACGHAPFLTQADLFNQQLEAWCQNIISAHAE